MSEELKRAIEEIEGINTLRQAEDYLRDAGRFSRAEAKSFLTRLIRLSQRDAGDGTEGDDELAALLNRATAILQTS